jgi:hypothetical protein
MASRRLRLNRTQGLVLGFFVFAWAALLVILAVAPGVYSKALRLPSGDGRPWALAFLVALSIFLLVLGVGVVKRWRWTFWLILVAFVLGGLLRVPVSALQLVGVLPALSSDWYALLQAFLGVVQFAIGLAMLAGYRRPGVMGKLLRHWGVRGQREEGCSSIVYDEEKDLFRFKDGRFAFSPALRLM